MSIRDVWSGISLCILIELVTCEGENLIRHGDDRPVNLREMKMDEHNRIQMGVADPDCDDGENNIEMDWNPDDSAPYTCDGEPDWDKKRSNVKELREILKLKRKNGECKDNNLRDFNNSYSCYWLNERIKVNADWNCLNQSKIAVPNHICLDEAIEYDENPPRSGSHRPLWPMYGEYVYCPPQRWTHSLEHGAVVMLYDPCVLEDPILAKDLTALNRTLRDCVRRHVITPFKGMPQPFALTTYGCRLLMDRVNEDLVALFIKNTALQGPEHLADNGQYDKGLIHNATTIYNSGLNDDNLCPKWRNPLLND